MVAAPRRLPLRGSRVGTLALLSLVAGLALTIVVAVNDGLLPGEQRLLRLAHEHLDPWLGWLAGLFDAVFTDTSATVVFVGLGVVVALSWGRWAVAVFVLAGAATALARLGNLVDRPRPDAELGWSASVFAPGGYPSGHVVYFVLVFGTVVVLSRRRATGRTTTLLAAIAVPAIVLVGLTRLVRAEHWPADVVGAYLLSLPALLAVGWIHDHAPVAWQRRRAIPAQQDRSARAI